MEARVSGPRPRVAVRPFADVYRDEVWAVYGFIGYRVRSRELAEDLTQETFVKALRAYRRYDPSRASEKSWLLSIARNVVIDSARRAAGPAESELEPAIEAGAAALMSPGPEESARGLTRDEELQAALRTLPPREREILALRFGGDLKGREIAQLTGLSLANVQQILSRSLRKLREELIEGEGWPSA